MRLSSLSVTFGALLLVFVGTADALDNKCDLATTCTECDCYWSSECGAGKSCNYSSGCTHSGKLDGTCTASGANGGFTPAEFALAATELNLWFDGYQHPTPPKKWLPDPTAVKRIGELRLNPKQHSRVRFAAFNAIDVTLGFDFTQPPGNCQEYDPRCLGSFRIAPDKAALALLATVQEGFAAGLTKHDRKAFEGPIRRFWRKYPKFAPHHTGRCYPHGHVEHDKISPSECQIDELSRILEDLLTPASAEKSNR